MKTSKNIRSSNYLHYKNYVGNVEFSGEDAVFHGKVMGIKSLISFEGDSVSTITEDFRNAIDEYLEICAKNGKQPEKPFKGDFNVHIGADLHRKAVLTASKRGISLNKLVENAILQTADP
jgi:predicted HicB family RNase H-like nuclease